MAEDEVCYATVVFKGKKRPEEAGNHHKLKSINPKHEEETVYSEVKVQSKAPEPGAEPEPEPEQTTNVNKKETSRLLHCLLVITLVLLVTVIGLCVYVTVVRDHTVREMNQFKEKQETLQADNDNLKRNNTDMVEQLDRLNSNITYLAKQNRVLENQNQVLENQSQVLKNQSQVLENQNQVLKNQSQVLENQSQVLENQNQVLETEKKNLTDQILNWNKLNVSRAQWTIEAYCPKNRCTHCQTGWKFTEPRCYAVNNANRPGMKSWEDAQKDCLEKMSDLAVVHTQEEKEIINNYSWDYPRGSKYWIGLRVVDGKWKWVDGTDLKDRWISAPVDGHCAVSIKSEGWKSEKCDARGRWICTKDALSLK